MATGISAQRSLFSAEEPNGGLLDGVVSEHSLIAAAVSLGAPSVAGLSLAESRLADGVRPISQATIRSIRDRIRAGEDPLGDVFCQLRSPEVRRSQGATYTPQAIVTAMVDWAVENGSPRRVVDPGVGSGRFLAQAGARMPQAELVGIEIDPLAALLARANLAALGMAGRSRVLLADYRAAVLPPVDGRTLFIGNPPYVRHHGIGSQWKAWLVAEARKWGCSASQLAGLHVHFFLATLGKARQGDYGAFITAAEWLDVNYGGLLRELLLSHLGGKRIVVIEPTAAPFPDAATTAAITYFEIGARPKRIRMKRVANLVDLGEQNGNCQVPRERLLAEKRWSHLTRPGKPRPEGFIELGELCRVHRGQVTGANKVWIAGPHSLGLPECVLFPTVTKARELLRAGDAIEDASSLRRVIDLPSDLDVLDPAERKAVDRFLATARSLGADKGYIAANRKAWWSVGLKAPAPILATYMARRPPAFVHNRAMARHLNIAHGIYPREPLSRTILDNLASYLRESVDTSQGRTYAGGLTKFEPKEMERLLIPSLDLLANGTF